MRESMMNGRDTMTSTVVQQGGIETGREKGGSGSRVLAASLDARDHPQQQLHGTYQERFAGVRDVFAAHLGRGLDVGASVAVFIDGEPVVDLWGGFLDIEHTQPWQRDTIVNVFSATKTMTALCALVLADRGEIDLDAPVAKYWPEFAAAGKERVLVRQIVSHTSGLCGWDEPLTLEDIYDWEKSTTLLARQAPWYEPGTAGGYQGMTMGHLVGEVVRRVTGMSMGTFFAREIAGPLGGDFYIGTGPEHDSRVARLIQGAPRGHASGAMTMQERAYFNPYYRVEDINSIPWRRAEIGGANGHGNAYGIAAIQSVLACGGEARGVRLLSEATCRRVLETQSDGIDLVLGGPVRWGMGYTTKCAGVYENPTGAQVAMWGGNGGALSYVDFDQRMSVGFAQNHWIEGLYEGERRVNLLNAVYAALAN